MDNIKRDNLFSGMFILCIAVFVVGVCEMGNASDSPKSFLDAPAILEAWQRNYGSIKSMQVSYTERVLDANAPSTDPNRLGTLTMVMHVQKVEEGKRYHIRYSKAKDGFTNPKNLMEHAFDGIITREYVAMHELGTIDPGLLDRFVNTMNHQKMYMLLTPIQSKAYQEEFPDGIPMFSQILRSGISRSVAIIRSDLEPVAGELCHVVEIMYKSPNFGYKIWVAHNRGMLPLKYQRYDNNKVTLEIEVEQIAKAETDGGDIWYPVKAYRTKDKKNRGRIKWELITHAFVPNVKVDENTFRFDFPSGTHVVDRVLGLEYVVGVK